MCVYIDSIGFLVFSCVLGVNIYFLVYISCVYSYTSIDVNSVFVLFTSHVTGGSKKGMSAFVSPPRPVELFRQFFYIRLLVLTMMMTNLVMFVNTMILVVIVAVVNVVLDIALWVRRKGA